MERPYRVVVAKPGLDGHDRGARVIARALREAGFEVIYTGLHQTPEQIAETVIQEDADAVGLSILSGAHMTLFPRIIEDPRGRGAGDVLVFAGRDHPRGRHPELKRTGVAEIFTPGAPLGDITGGWRSAGPEGDRRRPADAGFSFSPSNLESFRSERGSVRISGQAVLRPLWHPGVGRRRRRHRRRGRGRGRQGGVSRRRQGPGAGGRAGQGRRGQAGRRRRRGAPPRRQHPRPRHQGPRRAPPVGRARLGHRQGVLRQLHLGPGRQEVPRHGVGQGRGRDRAVAEEDPEAIARLYIDPAIGFHRGRGPPLVEAAGLDPEAHDGAVAILLQTCTGATSRATPTWSRSTR
jgi:methylmalonyl-CoA mutase C-terminal domain/subunit